MSNQISLASFEKGTELTVVVSRCFVPSSHRYFGRLRNHDASFC